MCLSSVRHEDIKVIFDFIAALDGSEGTTIDSHQWIAQSEKVIISVNSREIKDWEIGLLGLAVVTL